MAAPIRIPANYMRPEPIMSPFSRQDTALGILMRPTKFTRAADGNVQRKKQNAHLKNSTVGRSRNTQEKANVGVEVSDVGGVNAGAKRKEEAEWVSL